MWLILKNKTLRRNHLLGLILDLELMEFVAQGLLRSVWLHQSFNVLPIYTVLRNPSQNLKQTKVKAW